MRSIQAAFDQKDVGLGEEEVCRLQSEEGREEGKVLSLPLELLEAGAGIGKEVPEEYERRSTARGNATLFENVP